MYMREDIFTQRIKSLWHSPVQKIVAMQTLDTITAGLLDFWRLGEARDVVGYESAQYKELALIFLMEKKIERLWSFPTSIYYVLKLCFLSLGSLISHSLCPITAGQAFSCPVINSWMSYLDIAISAFSSLHTSLKNPVKSIFD